MSIKRDYLHGTKYSLLQIKDDYHFNQDTELLGKFLKVYPNEEVLDIGTNQGALLYYAFSKAKIKATGIDLFIDVLNRAKENALYNKVDITFICQPIQHYRAKKFDVILCNPPYFHSSLKNDNIYIDAARRDAYLSLDDLMLAVHDLLKANGRFYLVHKVEKINLIMQKAFQVGITCSRMQIVYNAKKAKTVLWEFKWGVKRECYVEKAIYLNEHRKDEK